LQRFPRTARLLKPGLFRAVFENGRREHGRLLIATVASNGEQQARLGLAISKKAAPKAVARNRIKRQIRDSFRLTRNSLGGCDIVLTARPAARDADSAILRADLDEIWKRIRRKWPGC